MKVAITGHTKGLGKALANEFTKNGYEVIGFSKSNGYDISLEDTRSSILTQLSDVDVFINNAYVLNGQTELLKSLIKVWEGTTKSIINISSKAALAPVTIEAMKEYAADKKNQDSIILKKVFTSSPYILNVIPGLIDTDMAESFSSKKLDPIKLAALIYFLFENKQNVSVQSIVLDVPEQIYPLSLI